MDSLNNLELQEVIPGYKMFIGGLEPSVQANDLLDYFGQYGEITWVELIGKKKKVNKGYAFMKFKNLCDLQNVIKSPHYILGREVDCKIANSDASALPQVEAPAVKPTEGKIYIPLIPSFLTKEDIRKHFSQYGELTEVLLMIRRKETKSFAYVGFSKKQDALNVCFNKIH